MSAGRHAPYRLPRPCHAGGHVAAARGLARRGAAGYVERLLKGARPSDLPINRIANYDLVIDKSVAGGLGIAIPQTLLLRANRVIE